MANARPWYISIGVVAVASLRLLRLCASTDSPSSYDYTIPQPQIDYGSLLDSLDAGHETPAPPPPAERTLMATDGQSVVVADPAGDGISVVPKAGGARKLLAKAPEGVGGLAIAGGTVYFTTTEGGTGAVMSVPVRGGATPKVLAAGLRAPRAVVTDGKWIYVADSRLSTPKSRHAVIVRLPAAGGDTTDLADCMGEAGGLALDDTSVYWTDLLPGDVVAMPKAGGAQRVVAADRDAPAQLASDGAALYWVEGDAETLYRLPNGGSEPAALAKGVRGGFVPSAGGVLFGARTSEADDLSLMRVPKQGGEATAVSGPVENMDAFTTDGSRLYWTVDGAVWAAAPGAKGPAAARKL